MIKIEEFPFFRSFDQAKERAVIDVEVFEKWLSELDVDLLTPEDKAERDEAYKELEKGEALDLNEAMKEW